MKIIKGFNLSKKRQDKNKGTNFIRYAYPEEDVKEFIRVIKQFSRKIKGQDGDWINVNVIDENAGDKLSSGEEEKEQNERIEKLEEEKN